MIARRVTVLLAFGSNLGDRAGVIEAAQRELANHPGISSLRASSLHETVALRPHGPDVDAPRYLNGVALAETSLAPLELLDLLQRIEAGFGRTREEPWADRTLDIDLVLYGGQVIREDRLTVPHPRAHEREFVLAPWLELDPHAVLIGHGRVADLLARLRESRDADDRGAVTPFPHTPAGGSASREPGASHATA